MGPSNVRKLKDFLAMGELMERVADELAAHQYFVWDNFLLPQEVTELVEVVHLHRAEDQFRKAGIGNAHLFLVNKEVRGDYIKWIEPATALPASLRFLERMEELRKGLNRLLFLSLKDMESHFAVYPPGTFYEKHLDQFKSTNNRKISFALYLNPGWAELDGGELRLYGKNGHLDVEPVAGRLALFRSDTVEHEVLLTKKDRFSITGWMRDRPVDLPYF